jgi:hypothetical protein
VGGPAPIATAVALERAFQVSEVPRVRTRQGGVDALPRRRKPGQRSRFRCGNREHPEELPSVHRRTVLSAAARNSHAAPFNGTGPRRRMNSMNGAHACMFEHGLGCRAARVLGRTLQLGKGRVESAGQVRQPYVRNTHAPLPTRRLMPHDRRRTG